MVSEEVAAALSCGNSIEKESYFHRVQEGDYVRLAKGACGSVRMIEYIPIDLAFGFVGQTKIVSIDIDGAPRRWFGLRAPIPVRIAGPDINRLELIATHKELEEMEQGEAP